MYDVVVVGGGPAGCHTASLLGQRGLDVHVFEEHSGIGEPVDCSGVIGAESFDSLGLSDRIKLGRIDALTLVSPSNLEVKYSPPFPLAYIIDRAALDRSVAERALASGVSFHLRSQVVDLEVLDGCVEAVVREETGGRSAAFGRMSRVNAKVAILAGGPRYRIQKKLGLGQPKDFLRTAQTEAAVRDLNGAKVFLGSKVAPGSFAWIVPFKRGAQEFARIGVSVKSHAALYLRRLLERLHAGGHLFISDPVIRSWLIPLFPLKRTYAERVLVVGDAAGQTKPTTGGGIYYSMLAAEAAAGAAIAAFKTGNFSSAVLSRYETHWRKKLALEIRLGAFFRRLAERLNDDEIDSLFRVVQSNGVLAWINSNARFDWHRDVIGFALRHPTLGKIFVRGLFR